MSGKVKLLRYLANLGYGSRREVLGLLGEGRVTDGDGGLLYGDDVRGHDDIRIDGQLLHRIISPKSKLPKVYRAELAQDLRGDEGAAFASGTLMLESETTPLLPAELEVLGPRHVRLTLHEGRYHQVRRMFAAAGNHVEALHRERVGGLELDGLAEGEWRLLDEEDRALLFG